MHAIYCFLHRQDDFDLDLMSDFLHLDDNNWYQVLATVTDQGELIPRCPENDWRGRDGFQKSLLDIPKEERWDKAVQTAKDILKYEIVTTLMMLDDYKEYKGEQDYASLEEALRKKLAEKAHEASPYALERASAALSALKWRTGPFAEYFGDPYRSLRTYAHNVQIEDEDLAITFVDIHT